MNQGQWGVSPSQVSSSSHPCSGGRDDTYRLMNQGNGGVSPINSLFSTAGRLPSRPLAPAERLPPRPLASNDNYLSYPSVQNNDNNNYTPRVHSSHSHPPHHKRMRDLSLSLHPYSGRDNDSYGLMTPMSANNNKTAKSPTISSNHSNIYSNISNHNDNYSDSSINYHTTSTISSPQPHHYTIRDTEGHHQQSTTIFPRLRLGF